MISPQEAGITYVTAPNGTYLSPYPGSTTTEPTDPHTYWRKRIGEEIAIQIETDHASSLSVSCQANECACAGVAQRIREGSA